MMSAHLSMSLFMTMLLAIPSGDSDPTWPDSPPLPGQIATLGDDRFRHDVRLQSLAYSPNGQFIATLGYRRLVRIWDARSGRLVRDFPEVEDGNYSQILFSPDNELVAIGGVSRPVRVWEVRTGRERTVPTKCRSGFAFLNANTLVCRIDNDNLSIVRLENETPLSSWHRPGAFTGKIVVSADQSMLASAGQNGAITIWVPSKPDPVHEWPGTGTSILSFALSPDGSELYTLTEKGIASRNVANGKITELFTTDGPKLQSFDLTPDGQSILSLNEAGLVRLHDAMTGELRLQAETDRPGEAVPHISPDGRTFALRHGWFQSCPTFWSLETLRPLPASVGHTGTIWDLRFDDDGQELLSTGLDRALIRWDLATRTGTEMIRRPPPDRQCCCAFSPDGRLFATGSADKNEGLGLWVVETGERRPIADPIAGTVYAVAFSPDRRLLAAMSKDKIHLWDAQNGDLVRSWSNRLGTGYLHPFCFSGDGSVLLAAGNKRLEVRTVADGTVQFAHDVDSVTYRAAVSDDGETIVWASSSSNSTLSVARPNLARTVRTAELSGRPLGVALSPDAALVAVGLAHESGGAVEVWEIESMRLIRRAVRISSPVMTLTFSPDGRTLAIGGTDSTIILWDVSGQNRTGK